MVAVVQIQRGAVKTIMLLVIGSIYQLHFESISTNFLLFFFFYNPQFVPSNGELSLFDLLFHYAQHANFLEEAFLDF